MSEGTIDYWSASWCQPCKVMMPKVKAIAEANYWTFVEHDIEVDQAGALALGILGVPTVQVTPRFGGFATVLNNNMASIRTIKKAMGL